LAYECAWALPHARALAIAHATGRIASAADPRRLLRSLLRLVFCQALFQIRWRFELWLLRCTRACCARPCIARSSSAFSFSLGELLKNALVVALNDLIWYTFHTEDFDIQTGAIRERVFDDCEGLLVDLGHMDRQTWGQR